MCSTQTGTHGGSGESLHVSRLENGLKGQPVKSPGDSYLHYREVSVLMWGYSLFSIGLSSVCSVRSSLNSPEFTKPGRPHVGGAVVSPLPSPRRHGRLLYTLCARRLDHRLLSAPLHTLTTFPGFKPIFRQDASGKLGNER